MSRTYDAIVVGSGPNGLSAAIALAQAQHSVLVVEAAATVGGGMRTAERTLPGFRHDICSSVHPLAVASPFWKTLPLQRFGLEWIHPPITFAHPLDNGTAVAQWRSLDHTASRLGADAPAYRQLMAPFVANAERLFADLVGPLGIPQYPWLAARFGWLGLRSAQGLAEAWFRTPPARALLAGLAAHAVLPLDRRPSAAVALMLGIAGHHVGWPSPRGGAQQLANALAAYFRQLGGEIQTGWPVKSLAKLPPTRVVLLDLSPRHVVTVAGHCLPHNYCRQLLRFRHGPGVFKVDWALAGPIPWQAVECRQAGTVHVGGTWEEVATAEIAPWRKQHAERPFVMLTQPGAFDSSRAPPGQTTAWGYCHVPPNSTLDMTARIEAQVERFAPGFRDLILARHTMNCQDMENYNPNYIGGDIVGGIADLRQLFARPTLRLNPYTTPHPDLFLCSASTPPGAGVHGMCGYFAAQAALRRLRRLTRQSKGSNVL
ncbi:MAG: NAD(P)/FAD-dependent oxidoreductase [Gemmataceae bacterium]|nr:NAD(P)/FAD-dependent oxidoreductase [Gemmata sp.]MDW8197000.1 NAD(P)/FAD-dependent oxidoreductase [Gemmataceae bacterium]